MRRFYIFLPIMMIAVLLFPTSSFASDLPARKAKGLFTVKFGYAGSVKMESYTGFTHNEFDNALSAGFAVEFPIFNNDWLTGVGADLYKLKREGAPYFDDREWCLNFFWSLKGNIGYRKNGLIIRPGFGIGHAFYIYRTGSYTPYQFTTLQATTEIIIGSGKRPTFMIEFGVIAAPFGDNLHRYSEIKPLPIIRVGLQTN